MENKFISDVQYGGLPSVGLQGTQKEVYNYDPNKEARLKSDMYDQMYRLSDNLIKEVDGVINNNERTKVELRLQELKVKMVRY